MKITVIKSDGFVSIDGEGYDKIDLSLLDRVTMLGASVRAIQWHGTFGDVEFGNSQGQVVANFRIEDFTQFEWVVESFNTRKSVVQAEQAEKQRVAAEMEAQLAAQASKA